MRSARWRVREIRGPGNADVSPETRKTVERWLDEAQRG
jgi:hypothetical protein